MPCDCCDQFRRAVETRKKVSRGEPGVERRVPESFRNDRLFILLPSHTHRNPQLGWERVGREGGREVRAADRVTEGQRLKVGEG